MSVTFTTYTAKGIKRSIGYATGRFLKDLAKEVDDVIRIHPTDMADFVEEALQPIWDESQRIVPIDTGLLRDSGRFQVSQRATGVDVRMSYGNGVVNYATLQHEDMSFYHAAPGQAKFLEQPIVEGLPEALRKISQEIKNRTGKNIKSLSINGGGSLPTKPSIATPTTSVPTSTTSTRGGVTIKRTTSKASNQFNPSYQVKGRRSITFNSDGTQTIKRDKPGGNS